MNTFLRLAGREHGVGLAPFLIIAILSSCSPEIEHASVPPQQSASPQFNATGLSTSLDEIVAIEFPVGGYTFTLDEAASGVSLQYRIVVKQDCTGIVPLAFGPSFSEPPGPSKLHPRETISGGGQYYCLADFGLAAPVPEDSEVAIELKQGVYAHSFDWDGRNWSGPSDYGSPKGSPFPAGDYKLTVVIHGKRVTAQGKIPYQIEGTTQLNLK